MGRGCASGLIIAPAGRWDVIYNIEQCASVISAVVFKVNDDYRRLDMFIGVADRADDYDLQGPGVVSAIRRRGL